MDAILAAIMQAIPAVAAATVTDGLKDAYCGLKALIQRKWGEKGDVTKSLDALEREPGSQDRAEKFRQVAEANEVQHDEDIKRATEALLAALAGKGPASAGPTMTANLQNATIHGIGAIGVNNGPTNFRQGGR